MQSRHAITEWSETTSLAMLPADCIHLIMATLEARDLVSLTQTCKRFHDVIKKDKLAKSKITLFKLDMFPKSNTINLLYDEEADIELAETHLPPLEAICLLLFTSLFSGVCALFAANNNRFMTATSGMISLCSLLYAGHLLLKYICIQSEIAASERHIRFLDRVIADNYPPVSQHSIAAP